MLMYAIDHSIFHLYCLGLSWLVVVLTSYDNIVSIHLLGLCTVVYLIYCRVLTIKYQCRREYKLQQCSTLAATEGFAAVPANVMKIKYCTNY